ncbi:hypothetical protein CFC21_107693 [Triticum aestivum]|uniref:DUF295 domain-containing protein n=2 Tax=Triticum aestivum TaxID=4565 RepID=A0A9R1MGK7_WHEAT|nr:hypothetical protein CFC21_107693 [Triticum aestivum]
MAAYPSTSAFGTRILAMDTGGPEDLDVNYFLILDNVRARGVAVGPRQDFLVAESVYYLPVGNNKLFILSREVFVVLCLEERCPPAPVGSSSMEWSRQDIPEPPFNARDVASYAMHPDGRTFLFSTKKKDASEATFAFDTEELLWKRLGNWALPLAGRGYFDPHLDAFVGLSDDPDTLGQLYCCYAVPGSDNGDRAPEWKLCKEKLFSDDDPAKRHVNATLVHMGCHGKFCLVLCVYVQDDEDDTADHQPLIDEHGVLRLPPGCRRLYRLTTFSLSHDNNGDLTTGKSRQVHYYKVPKATTNCFVAEGPVAFWI